MTPRSIAVTITLAVCLFFSFLTIATVDFDQPTWFSLRNAPEVEAKILHLQDCEHDTVTHRSKGRHGASHRKTEVVTRCDAEYTYTYDNQTYNAVTTKRKSNYKAGDSVRLYIDKDNPEAPFQRDSVIDNTVPIFLSLFFFIVGLMTALTNLSIVKSYFADKE